MQYIFWNHKMCILETSCVDWALDFGHYVTLLFRQKFGVAMATGLKAIHCLGKSLVTMAADWKQNNTIAFMIGGYVGQSLSWQCLSLTWPWPGNIRCHFLLQHIWLSYLVFLFLLATISIKYHRKITLWPWPLNVWPPDVLTISFEIKSTLINYNYHTGELSILWNTCYLKTTTTDFHFQQ